MSRARNAALLLLLGLVAMACSGSRRAAVPGPAREPKPRLYVALGGGETGGAGTPDAVRDAWPQVLFRSAFARGDAFVNLGTQDATTSDALALQVGPAVALHPDVVTVSIDDDLFADVTTADYEQRLGRIVQQLRAGGATRVLLATIPPLDHQPGYLACLPDPPPGLPCRLPDVMPPSVFDARVDAYNAAIARVAVAQGATLVDLHAAGLAARAQGREAAYYAGNEFSPNTEGHRAIAAVFARALSAR